MNMPFSYRVVAVACGLLMAGTSTAAEIVVRYHYSADTLHDLAG